MFVNPFHEPPRARNRVSDIGEWWWGWRGYDNSGRLCVEYLCDRTRKWLYDGWNIVRSVLDDGCATETCDYVWGTDLSGTMDGAGGVGGLLAVRQGGVWHFPLYDANGNITAYISETGAVSATYAYGPFGETVAHTGMDFEHRFSTKPWDETLGTYTYICRDYSPVLGRWLSEDPILEQGGYNLYAYCGNEPVGRCDYLGLEKWFVKQIYATESHDFGCPEWSNPGYTGKADFVSYRKHFKDHTLNNKIISFLKLSDSKRFLMANDIIRGLDMDNSIDDLWAMTTRFTGVEYTDYYKDENGVCVRKVRFRVDIVVLEKKSPGKKVEVIIDKKDSEPNVYRSSAYSQEKK